MCTYALLTGHLTVQQFKERILADWPRGIGSSLTVVLLCFFVVLARMPGDRKLHALTYQDYHADGALALETPSSPSDLKIILSGKFLEPTQVLDGAFLHHCVVNDTPNKVAFKLIC